MEHIEELGNSIPDEMVVFFKPNASISDVLYANQGEPLHYEGEICLGIEKGEIRYLGFGLDLTKRTSQNYLKERGLPWERSKAFRGAALFSGFVSFDGEFADLEMELWIDGKREQRGGIGQMIHKPCEIISELKVVTELEDFDVVMTGTPKGVGRVVRGSVYEGIILRNGVELVRHSWLAV